MQLIDAVSEFTSELNMELAIDEMAPAESSIAAPLVDALDAGVVSRAIDCFGLDAIEGGVVGLLAGGTIEMTGAVLRVTADSYLTTVEKVRCVPLVCAVVLTHEATMRDVIPLPGDYAKVFGLDTQVQMASDFVDPTHYVDMVNRIVEEYESAAGTGRYGDVAAARSALWLQGGLWMLRGITLGLPMTVSDDERVGLARDAAFRYRQMVPVVA